MHSTQRERATSGMWTASWSAPTAAALNRRIALAITALVAATSIGGCGNDDGGPPPPAVPVGPPPITLGPLTGSTKDVTVDLKEGTNMAVSPSPDGTRLVFSAQGALWMMPVSGGNATRISAFDVEPTAPVWAPDGRTIAFQNYTTDGNFHIWSINPDGSNPQELTTGFFDDREPAWTPDGSALVFSSDRGGDGQYKIWSYTLASRQYTQITRGNGAESNPVVSPDGRQVAYVDTSRIFTVPIGGGTPVLAAAGNAPAFAQDGTLVFQSTARTLNVAGRDVVTDEDLFPFPARFLPNGSFVYTADGRIRIRDAAGGNLAQVSFDAQLKLRRPVLVRAKDHHFDDVSPRAALGISAPALSPDGRSVAFVALNDVWVMTIGQPPVRLTNDTDRDGNPQWTSDGSAVYFSTEKGNAGALAVDQINVATRARTRLAAIVAKSMVTPMLSPNGDRIAYTTLSGQLEIWNVATRTPQVVIAQVGSQVSTPYWTPDGTRIMLVDNDRINNRFREGYNKLRVIDVAARTARFYPVAEAPRQISEREEGAAALSPDGRTVAFVMDSVLHVMAVNPDGSPAGAAQPITTEVADLPSWAGDSKTLLYKSANRLRLIQSDGSNARDLPLTLNWTQAIPAGVTIVRAGQLWDGTGSALRSDVDIVITGNRITAIRPHDAASVTGATRYVDASALTVMPGIWDPHIHPLTLYQGGQYGQVAALLLSYGITSTLSVAGGLHQSTEIREALDAGNLIGPRLFTSPGLWEGNRLFYSFARTLRTPAIADLEIAKAKAMDVDFLKSYVRAPIPVMSRIAQGALDQGIPSGTHMIAPGAATGIWGTTHLSATQRMGYGWAKSANGLISYQDAYDVHGKADFHSIDTLFSALALVGQDPAMLGDDRFRLLVPPNFVAGLRATPVPSQPTLDVVLRDARQSAKVQSAGGLLALGTDSPLVTPGISLHVGLRAGALVYSNVQALQNVTINAARMAFVDKDLGTVEVGKLADLTMVRGNPVQDVKNAANVEIVVKNGNVYTLAQILAPFRTPAAMAARKAALFAYARRCASHHDECDQTTHAD